MIDACPSRDGMAGDPCVRNPQTGLCYYCGTQMDDQPAWIDKHSVNCYFCGILFDEKIGMPADSFNNNEGGDICPDCFDVKSYGKDNP